MNTPVHLILGAAAFARPDLRWTAAAATFGAFLPDLSLYLMAGWHLMVLGTPGHIVFDILYFSDTWQQVFAVDNSFVLWGIGLGLAVWFRVPWLIALTGAALLHLALDFPLHSEDARMHFWPITEWKFFSPLSYWEGARGGDVIGLVEMALLIGCLIILFMRFQGRAWRWAWLGIGALQIAPFFMWRLVF